ncbi:hypothetical protein SSX86_002016 [Deinandra increscens subsp. villosa]|uniref:Ataxin-2 C-terminal domain-containing protein n=1 Tax=Deinandra increscens subsp. villosa TaxID=3103831 RepID=A0AAP0DN85_9ASTR
MDVMAARENGLLSSSALNPNAPMFVSAAYRNVEDFSDQWWSLVHSSPSFRDYWLRECFSDSQLDVFGDYDTFVLPEEDLLFSGDGKIEEEKKFRRDLIMPRLSNWRKARVVEAPRLYEKAPKIVKVKVSPRLIHQPR